MPVHSLVFILQLLLFAYCPTTEAAYDCNHAQVGFVSGQECLNNKDHICIKIITGTESTTHTIIFFFKLFD